MIKILNFFIFFFYVLPIIFIINLKNIYSITIFFIIIFSYYISQNLIRLNSKPFDYHQKYTIKNSTLFLIFILYILFRFDLISETFNNLIENNYIESGLRKVTERYNGESFTNNNFRFFVGTNLLFTISFILPLVDRNLKYLKLILFSLIIIVEISAFARTGLLIFIAIYTSGYIIKENKKFALQSSFNSLKYVFIIVFFFSIIFFLGAILRLANENEIIDFLKIKISEYIIAPYQAFLDWLSNFKYDFPPISESFTSISKLLGQNVKQGYYDLVYTDWGYTNVFLNLRGILNDVGILGAIFFFAFTGIFIKNYTYKEMGMLQYIITRCLLLFLCYPIISIYIFTSVLSSIFIFIIILIMTNLRTIR